MSADIRKWFLKPHQKPGESQKSKDEGLAKTTDEAPKITSKYFATEAKSNAEGDVSAKSKGKRPNQDAAGPSPKKPRSAEKAKKTNDSDDFVDSVRNESKEASPKGRGRGAGKTAAEKKPAGRGVGKSNADKPAAGRAAKPDTEKTNADKPAAGRGAVKADTQKPAGGRGAGKSDTVKPAGGRGRGGFGRGGFGAREPPPHKGEKEVPEGAENALSGLTFVISGTLDSLEREEAEDLIKRHGGRITSAVSKKTSFLLADEDVEGQKSKKAKELGIPFLTEDDLFEKVRASKPKVAAPSAKAAVPSEKSMETKSAEGPRSSQLRNTDSKKMDDMKKPTKPIRPPMTATGNGVTEVETWPDKHKPKSTDEIIANQSIVKQLKDWLQNWDEHHLHTVSKGGKGKKAASSSSNVKKAALLSGPPGIGKTTTARLLCNELGYEALEVNASDNRGKADSKIQKGIGGSTANTIKEMVSNDSLSFKNANRGMDHRKPVLIMDEVDGMSGGDRGGVTDLLSSIKISKIPIICICNDRYSQKLKSLANYCLQLSYRKPTKQQMAKRLQQIARAEGLNIDEIALEELSDRTHGDMRLALNQLQYMSLHTKVLKYADIKAYSTASRKDEDITPFSAVDKLMSFDGGRLRMDERIDLAMSDLDLVPLLIQENYVNYSSSSAGRDENGTTRMDLLSQAAASIADGDIVNVQIRRFRQWQHAQMGAFMSSIIPCALMHGKREVLTQGERNFNRFAGWLGKNSTFGKKTRLLEDVHVHLLASRICEPTREAVRLDYLSVLGSKLTLPLRTMDKNDAVKAVLDVMEEYSLTQEDFDSIMEVTKFEGHPDPLEGVPPAVKAALTKGYTQRQQDRRVRSADLLPSVLPGQKKVSRKKARLIIPEDLEDELPKEEMDEPAADEEGEGGADESEETDDKETGLDLLKNSNTGYEINVAGESKGGKRNTSKSQATQRKSQAATTKGASTSKGAKRKR